MWLFNPPEPTGQPTAPGPVDDLSQFTGFSVVNSQTRGRCGNCAACPAVWRLEIPELPGNPYANDYAGVYYLGRVPYVRSETGVTDSDHCSWSSILGPILPDGNTYHGPYNDGWVLTFRGDNTIGSGPRITHWMLYSPTESGGFDGDPIAGSRWVLNPGLQWFCLEANTLQLWGNTGELPFPYTPATLTVAPFPA